MVDSGCRPLHDNNLFVCVSLYDGAITWCVCEQPLKHMIRRENDSMWTSRGKALRRSGRQVWAGCGTSKSGHLYGTHERGRLEEKRQTGKDPKRVARQNEHESSGEET